MADRPDVSNPSHWARQPKAPIVMSTIDNLDVLYEDNHIIAVNKRSSDIVQSDSSGDTTLCRVVGEYIKRKYNKPGDAFIGTVHRLDRPVSGVILYARTSKALSRLTNMFRLREVHKTYWAVTKPAPSPGEGHVVNYLIKNKDLNKSFAHDTPGNGRKESELTYRTVGRSDHYHFVEVKPKRDATTRYVRRWRALVHPSKAISSTARDAPTTTPRFTYTPAASSSYTRSNSSPCVSSPPHPTTPSGTLGFDSTTA